MGGSIYIKLRECIRNSNSSFLGMQSSSSSSSSLPPPHAVVLRKYDSNARLPNPPKIHAVMYTTAESVDGETFGHTPVSMLMTALREHKHWRQVGKGTGSQSAEFQAKGKTEDSKYFGFPLGQWNQFAVDYGSTLYFFSVTINKCLSHAW